jgi:hypothetical protein
MSAEELRSLLLAGAFERLLLGAGAALDARKPIERERLLVAAINGALSDLDTGEAALTQMLAHPDRPMAEA